MKNFKITLWSILVMAFFFSALSWACSKKEDPTTVELDTPIFLPFSDPNNSGNWKLNDAVSDEFEAGPLDEEKWLIQGRNGEYKSNFIGRAPSQFFNR